MIRSEALDIALESRGHAIWWTLSGQFHNEQAPSIREKILALVGDGCRAFIIDMDKVTAVDDAVAPMFLGLLNTLKGKGGDMKFIFKNEAIRRAFQPYENLFSIFPDADSLSRENAVLDFLKKRGKAMTKKTGFRISRSVALFGLIVLCGWFLTLLYIINMQNQRIRLQQSELEELGLWKVTAEIDMVNMKERLLPLEQLGIIKDEPAANNK
jgi:anti-anti-sigma regulatory factor